jgi:hypothetical protein
MGSHKLEFILHLIEVLAAIVIATFTVLIFLLPTGSKFPQWTWIVLGVAAFVVFGIGARVLFQMLRPMTLIRSYVEPLDANLDFSPKFRVELRNDSGHCLDVTTSKWIEGQPLVHNMPHKTWQVFRDGTWTPSPVGEMSIHVHPGELVRTWMQFKGMNQNQVENARTNKWLGRLEVSASGKRFKLKL